MALVMTEMETLTETGEILTDKAERTNLLSGLVAQSREMCSLWNDYIVVNKDERNFDITPDFNFVFRTNRGKVRETNISDHAFCQLCARIGVPAGYVRKCMVADKTELALENFRSWADDCKSGLLVREYGDTVRAVLSDSYSLYDTHHVLKALNNTVNPRKYVPKQVHLSPDRLSIRFIGNEPLPIEKEQPLFAGFAVNSSDVGRGSLNMTFFIYRQVCSNGLVLANMGGTLFRQAHIGEKMTENKMSLFNQSFRNIDRLTANAIELIKENRKRTLKDYEVAMYLEKARRELKLSAKASERLEELVGGYGNTSWGIINSITELAQDYTLDTRIDFETWAGNMLTAKAA